jgi:membrane associated rhomboid family serine protease
VDATKVTAALDPHQVQQALDAMPAPWLVLLILGVIVGLTLLLLGGKLARPACALSGLILGGLAGVIASRELIGDSWLFPAVLIGAIGGCLLAWLLFRVWMAMVGAAILALAIPAAVLVWQGVPPQVSTDGDEAHAKPPAAAEARERAEAQEESGGALAVMQDRVREMYRRQIDGVRAWWDGLSLATRSTLLIAAAIGAAFGLMIGLLTPHAAAAVQSAIVGAVLILICATELARDYAPSQASWLPQGPQGTVMAVGLITLLGFAFQWTVFRRKTDK